MMKKLKEICFNADEDKSNNKDQSKNLTQHNCPKETSVTRKVFFCAKMTNIFCALYFLVAHIQSKHNNIYIKQEGYQLKSKEEISLAVKSVNLCQITRQI